MQQKGGVMPPRPIDEYLPPDATDSRWLGRVLKGAAAERHVTIGVLPNEQTQLIQAVATGGPSGIAYNSEPLEIVHVGHLHDRVQLLCSLAGHAFRPGAHGASCGEFSVLLDETTALAVSVHQQMLNNVNVLLLRLYYE